MRFFLPFLLLWSGCFSMYAQNCTYYFPTKVGTVIETKTYLANDQLIGTNTVTILENTGGVIKCSNAKGETYEIECQDGKFTINMDSYIQQMKKKHSKRSANESGNPGSILSQFTKRWYETG